MYIGPFFNSKLLQFSDKSHVPIQQVIPKLFDNDLFSISLALVARV